MRFKCWLFNKSAFGWAPIEWVCLAVLITLITSAPTVLYGGAFYFGDNVSVTFMPMFFEIGRQLTHGSYPFVTLKAWYGGGIAGEYGPGVFNPIILAFSSLFYLYFNDFTLAASVFAIFHL